MIPRKAFASINYGVDFPSGTYSVEDIFWAQDPAYYQQKEQIEVLEGGMAEAIEVIEYQQEIQKVNIQTALETYRAQIEAGKPKIALPDLSKLKLPDLSGLTTFGLGFGAGGMIALIGIVVLVLVVLVVL